MHTRDLFRITTAATLAVLTLAHPGVGATAAPAAARLLQSPTTSASGADSTTARIVHARRNVTRIFDDADGPRIRREDGKEFALTPLPAALKRQLEADAARQDAAAEQGGEAQATATGAISAVIGSNLTTTILSLNVDHRAYYGPIRDQGGRGTCVSFSTAAAIEGVYRRRDANRYQSLDLSEQWASHMQKMVSLADTSGTVSVRENQVGSWGGSECTYLMRVLQRYGLPEEGTMAYNGDGGYGPTSAGDPSFRLQRTTDDFNLDPSVLPLTALGRAPYRPTAVVNLTVAQVQKSDTLETLLRQGNDVVVDFTLVTPEDRTAQGAWTPGAKPTVRGGHSVLVIGFNPTRQYFLCRNSWGYDGTDGGFTRISYDYFAKYAYSGCYVTAVAEPSSESANGRLYVGRWKMNHDGWPGTLDIYRMPGLYTSAELKGQNDYRIGTYFDAEGHAFRVNGYVWGSDLVFYINFNRQAYNPPGALLFENIGAPYGALEGTRFVAQIFSWDDQNLAGLEVQDGVTYGFHATKGSTPGHVAAAASSNARDAALGHWKMNHDGWKGDLYLVGDGLWFSPLISGTYIDQDGKAHAVTGTVSGRNVHFSIWFGAWQEFNGYLYSWDKGLVSGVTYWGGTDFGFTAARVGD